MARQSLVLAGILLLSTTGRAQQDNGPECDCFKTNGSTEAYFSYHHFFDYRNVPSSLTSNPKVITDPRDTSDAKNTSAFFSNSSWIADWAIQNWDNSDSLNTSDSDATVLMINSPNNVYIGVFISVLPGKQSNRSNPFLTESSTDGNSAYSTYLTLRTARTENFQSAAEIDSKALNYHYLSARFLARIIGDLGGCAGMFTWRCPTASCSTLSSNVEEADIEVLTKGPQNRIQLTNQPSESTSGQTLSQATLNATLPGGVEWSTWNEYRYDWLPGISSWYVNGMSVGNISFQAPKNPAGLILNMWSNGGSWTGNMSIGGTSYLQVQWIEIVYNTSDATTGSKRVRSEYNLMEQVSEPPKSQVGEQFGPFGELPRLDGHKGVAPRADNSTGCSIVCSVDTNVVSAGTPVVLNVAGLAKERQATELLIIILVLLGLWFI